MFAPVAHFTLVRLLISLANHFNWDLDQLDVSTAFLYAKLKEPIYMLPPAGFPGADGRIMKLNQCHPPTPQ